LMMAVAEATSSNGTLLGALMTFVLYGVLPTGLVLYFMGSPGRKRAIREREKQETSGEALPVQPNTSSEPAADAVPAVRKEP
jgi:cell division protein FtsN